MALTLKNPHSILAALQQRPRDVVEVRLPPKGASPAWETVRQLAGKHGVKLTQAQRKAPKPQRQGGGPAGKTGREGGGEAVVREAAGLTLAKLFADGPERAEGRGLWLALDCLQDPHNLGAIFRSAAFFGVQGVLMTADRAAPMSAVVYDTAAGGVEHVPFCVQTNLSESLKAAKDLGLWVLGTSERAELDASEVTRDRPWLLVIGNESKGLRRLTRDRCDLICRITPRGAIGSLNASVAAGILMANLS
ncbi:MAG: RNA methyltransferase [Planctomycetes bacterium]|nr:RNA methyltransferase [Planctomycetota bacterium]